MFTSASEHGHFQPYIEPEPQHIRFQPHTPPTAEHGNFQPYIESVSESADNASHYQHHTPIPLEPHPTPAGPQNTTAAELPGDSPPSAHDIITTLLSHAPSATDIRLLHHLRNRLLHLEQTAATNNTRIQDLTQQLQEPKHPVLTRLHSQLAVNVDRIQKLTLERDRLQQTVDGLCGELRPTPGGAFHDGPADGSDFPPNPLHGQVLDENHVLRQHRGRLEHLMRLQEVEHVLDRAPVEAEVLMLRDRVGRLVEQRGRLAGENEELRGVGAVLLREVEEMGEVIEGLRRERGDVGVVVRGLHWRLGRGGE